MRELVPALFAEARETFDWEDPRYSSGELQARVMTQAHGEPETAPYLLVTPPDEYYALCFGDRAEYEKFRAWLDQAADKAWPR